jgi:hypothetical protein
MNNVKPRKVIVITNNLAASMESGFEAEMPDAFYSQKSKFGNILEGHEM